MANNNTKNLGGRPTTMTTETLAKLKQAFMIGCDDRTACLFADIGLQTLYDYQKKNPEYSEQKRSFKKFNKLQALKKISDDIPKDGKTAQWWLEKTDRKQFGIKQEITGANGKPLIPDNLSDKEAEEINLMITEQISLMNKDGSPKNTNDGEPVPSDTGENGSQA